MERLPGADPLLILAAILMGATLTILPMWTKAIGLGVAYWLVLRFAYPGVDLAPTYAAGYLGLFLATSLQSAAITAPRPARPTRSPRNRRRISPALASGGSARAR